MLKIFNQSGNYQEYKLRHSIDVSLRMLAFIACHLINLGDLMVYGRSYYSVNNQNVWDTAIVYYTIAFTTDLLYFACLIITKYFCGKQFNVCKALLIIYKFNWLIICIIVGLSLSFVLLIDFY